MDFYAKILSNDWLWLGNIAFAYFFVRAAWTAPWRSLWRNSDQFTAMVGLSMALTGLWLLPVGMRDGLSLHLLGAVAYFDQDVYFAKKPPG